MKLKIGHPLIGVLIVIPLFLSGCVADKKFKSDYSAPELALRTYFYATTHKMPGVVVDSLSEEMKIQYGNTREEQISNIRDTLNSAKISARSSIEIVKVEPLDSTHSVVTFNQLKDEKLFIGNLRTTLVFEGGEWKVAFDRN